MNGIIRASLYARVSSQKQADENTIDSQREAIRERIQNDGLHLSNDNTFCDDGYSGTELLRPGLEKLRDRIAASLIDRLYIHSPDRLSRKMAHQALLLEEFHNHQCDVIFLNQQGLPESPETNLLIQMQGMIAEYEREKILERTRRGRRHAAVAGNVSVFSGAPYGYHYICKSAGNGRASWEIDPVESEHVRLIFELVDQHGFSLTAVQRELAKRAIRTKKGKVKWSCTTIRGILINPAYYGRARYGKQRMSPRIPGKRVKRGNPPVPRAAKVHTATEPSDQVIITVPAIIDDALFQRVGKRMEENRKRQRERKDGAKYLLSGLLICGQCGSAYCARRSVGGRKPSYYRCIGTDKRRHNGKAICNNTSAKGEELESVVWSELCSLLENPGRLQAELDRRRKEQKTPNADLKKRQREVNQLRGRLDRLIDAYTNELIDRSEFESRVGPLREHHDREEATLASLRGGDIIDVDSAERALSQLATEVGSKLASAKELLKRQLLKLLIKQVEIHPEEIRIVYKVPQNPFVPSPDNRGFLQHRLQRQGGPCHP